MYNKTKKILLSSLCVVCLITTNTAVVTAKEETPTNVKVVNSLNNLIELSSVKDDEIYLMSADNFSIEEFKSLDIKLGLENENLDYVGLFNEEGNNIPIFISSDKELSVDEFETAAKIAQENYMENKSQNLSKADADISPFMSTNASYALQDTALGLHVTDNSTNVTYWYTEYRVYKDTNTTNVDALYLLAHHENINTRYGGGWNDRSLYKMDVTWDPVQSNVNTLNPTPISDNNNSSIEISLPWGISWSTSLGGSVDISNSHSINTDISTWSFTDWQLNDYFVLEDFQTMHGIEVESPTSNNGFSMSVSYNLWDRQPYIFVPSSDWWSDTITYVDSTGDVDFID